MKIGTAIRIGRVGGRFREAETTALLARMSSAPDATRQTQINTLVLALKTAGVWSKLDALYVTAAHDAQAALLNWKAAANDLTAVNTPTFTVDRGYAGNGTSSYLTTGVNLATFGGAYIQNDAHMMAWVRTGSSGYSVGNASTAAISVTGANLVFCGAQSAAASTAVTATGFIIWSRRLSTEYDVLVNSTAVNSVAGVSGATSSQTDTIGALNGSTQFSTQQVAAHSFGSNLSRVEMAAYQAAVQTYMQAVGAV